MVWNILGAQHIGRLNKKQECHAQNLFDYPGQSLQSKHSLLLESASCQNKQLF